MKKVIKIGVLIIGVILLLWITDYLIINIRYFLTKNNYTETITIQGNNNKYAPQGLAYSSKYNVVLQTSYNKKHQASRLYITDMKKNKLLKTLDLKDEKGIDNTTHVGGLTTDNKSVWITSDYKIFEYSLEEIMNTKKSFVQSKVTKNLPIRGDFCLYKNQTLWIGDFYLPFIYEVKDHNPLLLAYSLENINYDKPKLIISLPMMVQGMEINKNNEFVFTTSYSCFINSQLLIYKNVLKEKASTYKFKGNNIPYYKLTKEELISKRKLPPMAEEVFYKDNELYILFESSSDVYLPADPKIKRILKINKN